MTDGFLWEEEMLLSIVKILLAVSFVWRRSLLVTLLIYMQCIHAAVPVMRWNQFVMNTLLLIVQEMVLI